MNFKTEQELFWAGSFGNKYIDRNKSDFYLASNLHFFSNIFQKVDRPNSIIEFGANIGMNLKAIKLLFPEIKLSGIEINNQAADQLSEEIGHSNVIRDSIFNFEPMETYDVALIKGVLIHLNPDMLSLAYEKLYLSSKKYILICEYYNPTPVSVNYRGNSDKLFKRDFAGEMLQKFKNLNLINYGFCYKGDKSFPQDDITWFLLKKE